MMGPYWRATCIGGIKWLSILGLTNAVRHSTPEGRGRTNSVEVFRLSLPFGVVTVTGIGRELEVSMGRVT